MLKISHLLLIFVFLQTACNGDDLAPLRSALSCLCSSNKKGEFGSCCSSINIETDIDLDYIDCFGSIDTNSSFVTGLFVFQPI